MNPFEFVPLAYVDPGSGSMLIQVIIGTLLALPFFVRSQLGRAIRVIRRREPVREPEAGSEPATDPD